MTTKPWRQIRRERSKMTAQQEAAVEKRVRAELAKMKLAELRRARRLSQEELAQQLGIAQSEVSRLERRTDAYVQTLRRYIEAVGGKFTMIATFPDSKPIEIGGFGEIDPEHLSAPAPTESIRGAVIGEPGGATRRW
ncbi:MAG: XRE family transcriptional regulator [Candidatus Eremiobacteraeota bacterium]|nr:XRE family transcriptional regulator [Candidatus Eremiobacteraeota bacterium]